MFNNIVIQRYLRIVFFLCLMALSQVVDAQDTIPAVLPDGDRPAVNTGFGNLQPIIVTRRGADKPIDEADTTAVNPAIGSRDRVTVVAPPEVEEKDVTINKPVFNPDPQRALWMSALCPGLGQIYNRRYWKLPIIVGAYVGLGYATSWNNRMLSDYTKAYRDAMDADPSTRSYMDFYPPTVDESTIDMTWLQKALKNKKDYYRRYRDICIIAMVGVYLLSIVDAYVDASLAHFDISPDLSMTIHPEVLNPDAGDGARRATAFGVGCSLSF